MVLALLALGIRPAFAQDDATSDADIEISAESQIVTITGRLDGRKDRVALKNVALAINEVPVVIEKDGRFSAKIPRSAYYRLDIGGSAVFPMVQTFGGEELRDPACNCLTVPPIELVEKREGRIELFFGGDSMTGRRYLEANGTSRALVQPSTQEADLTALFRPMQPYYENSDLASINLESVMADSKPGDSPPKIYVFFSPTKLATVLKNVGIDYVTLGNNHTYDYSAAGLTNTMKALDQAGVHFSGAGEDISQAAAAKRLDLDGNRLSMLGYVSFAGYYAPNHVASAEKSGAMLGSMGNIKAGVRKEEKADRAPLMQLHGGYEFAEEPNEGGVKRMRMAVSEGAEMVVSHHPHVTQALEVYKGRLIAYSLGNFMFDQNFIETMSSYTLKAWMEDGKIFRVEVVPIHILDYRPVPAVGTMREASFRRVFALSARRDTHFYISGGHGVVQFGKNDRKQDNDRVAQDCVVDPKGIVRRRFNLAQSGESCATPQGGRYGRDLLMRGDFENMLFEKAEDRNWGTHQASHEIRTEKDGNHFLSLRPNAANQASLLFHRPYLRNLNSGNYSLLADVRVSRAAVLDFAIKEKPGDGEKPSALWKGNPPVGSVALNALPGWQRIRIDFTRPAPANKKWTLFRPVLSVKYLNGAAAGAIPVEIDNLSLVEWDERAEADLPPGEQWFATHWKSAP
jgi:poly-gamma-glutamate capsule biosynthesis protein CapA/YwtB (metallophosphatase superfamily)